LRRPALDRGFVPHRGTRWWGEKERWPGVTEHHARVMQTTPNHRCTECSREYVPDRRVGERQVTCGAPECQRERHRKQCRAQASTRQRSVGSSRCGWPNDASKPGPEPWWSLQATRAWPHLAAGVTLFGLRRACGNRTRESKPQGSGLSEADPVVSIGRPTDVHRAPATRLPHTSPVRQYELLAHQGGCRRVGAGRATECRSPVAVLRMSRDPFR
jgi:hypothetical protein